MTGEVTAVAEAVKVLLSIVDKILDRMPTYDQRKKEEYYNLKKRYEDELATAYPNRDDNLVDVYRRDLMQFASAFGASISREKIQDV